MINIDDTKKLVHEAGQRLLDLGLVSGTWGNISARADKNSMVITPSGRKYEELTTDEMVVVDIKNLTYEGKIKPSSELKLHAEIYQSRNKINAIIHTHQINASTVAAARREVPPILDDMAQIIGPSVRVAEYALPNKKKKST
jgi:L-fuculose-phosphate aldolase